MSAYRRLVALVVLALAWALGPFVDRSLGLTWAVPGIIVAVQALIWVVAGGCAYRLGKPSLRGSSWGMLAVGAIGSGLNKWWVAHMGGAILVGSSVGQVLHASLALGLGVLLGWAFRPVRRRRQPPNARTAAERLSERA